MLDQFFGKSSDNVHTVLPEASIPKRT